MIVYLFLFDLLNAFNENLTAVHYSIVTPGIDEEVKPGKINFQSFVDYHLYRIGYASKAIRSYQVKLGKLY